MGSWIRFGFHNCEQCDVITVKIVSATKATKEESFKTRPVPEHSVFNGQVYLCSCIFMLFHNAGVTLLRMVWARCQIYLLVFLADTSRHLYCKRSFTAWVVASEQQDWLWWGEDDNAWGGLPTWVLVLIIRCEYCKILLIVMGWPPYLHSSDDFKIWILFIRLLIVVGEDYNAFPLGWVGCVGFQSDNM